ncbi:uncharacterized protein LOC129755996 [Uranotaenia lowii]|uniref:uncharacterized protein LOC129739074 n=1 Tax=Uranotaenia lowii TaxID=190385 RepID=UPI002478F2F0|nr:uncharacterized protein LOC129739074 [Uranotaenia lowii]XP_055586430.1 uncharacterized protein LOC129739074 [Uranotaenia lowii]XP_055586431.1 uncharacterized protein LOC129739074 [Uranotaenia lowii]XP_055586432.1 uncharacterized protein LOC129739074 [Uranotaenia lowii]XP_055586433.1 uncharacterized protein LOC129739074 [Uranotaenia lowii]XP_055608719.1 uncharacterized protein LOC129755996 [Uranotaenia lowii]XP_055608728.1 uncharacterized protein LOC129755996 [Uranotaenia lowii]XP_05560873
MVDIIKNMNDQHNQPNQVSQNEPEIEPMRKIYQKFNYCETDSRPYRVIVENTDLKRRKYINRLQIGILLNQLGFDKCIDDIKKTGRNKATVYVGNMKDANRLADCQSLLIKGYKSYIPKKFVTVTGVISDIPLELNPNEIFENVICDVKVESVFRMTRRYNEERIPTNRVGIVFRSNMLPRYVRLFSVINRVEPFIPRPIICFKCLRYNHLSKNCQSSVLRCNNCTDEANDGHEPCPKISYCFHCKKEGHITTDRSCPQRKKESETLAIMARRNVTYQEARELLNIPTINQFDALRNVEGR